MAGTGTVSINVIITGAGSYEAIGKNFTVSGIRKKDNPIRHVYSGNSYTFNVKQFTSAYGFLVRNVSSVSSKNILVRYRWSGGQSANLRMRVSVGKSIYLPLTRAYSTTPASVAISALLFTCSAASGATLELLAFGK